MIIDYGDYSQIIRGFWICNLNQDYRDYDFKAAFLTFRFAIRDKLDNPNLPNVKNIFRDIDLALEDKLTEKECVILFDKIIHLQHTTGLLFKLDIQKLREVFEKWLGKLF